MFHQIQSPTSLMGLVFILLKISLSPQGGWERSTALHKGPCAMLWTHEPSVVMIISLPRRLASDKHQLLTFRAGKIHYLFFFFNHSSLVTLS